MNNHFRLPALLCIFLYSQFATSQSCEKLVWQDEFNGTTLDLKNWSYQLGSGCPDLCGWGNNEQQYYTNSEENVRVEDGKLIITAKEDTIDGFEYSSARINTKNKIDFKYGRVEARIKLPETQGLWPAFWMLSTEDKFGQWPRSGEIDIMELLGHKPTEIIGTIHTGLPWLFVGEEYSLPDSSSFADDFNVFSLEWSPDTIKWFVNDVQYHEITSDSLNPWEPFQENFHLLLNVAVGGNFPGFTDSTTVLPQTMEVDYVRVYSKIDDLVITGKTPVQKESHVKYKTFEIADAVYEWSIPDGSELITGQGTNEITVNWGCSVGDIILELQTDCDTVIISYPVSSFAESEITGPLTVDQNQTGLSYSVPSITGVYEWFVTEGATIVNGDLTDSITVDWGCEPGAIALIMTSSCGQDTANLNIDLTNYEISGLAFVQANSTSRVFSIDPIPNSTFLWSVPEGATITSGQGSNEITVDFGATGGDVSVEVANDCGMDSYSFAVGISTASLYCDFDGKDLEFGTFGGSVFEKIPNPLQEGINTSDHVGIMRKDPGSVDWAGIFADLGQEIETEETQYLHMKVYAPSTGIVKFKLEDQTTGVEPVELDLEIDATNEWINLVYDAAAVPTETFDRIALFFNFGDVDTSYWYFDDILASTSTVLDIKEIGTNSFDIYPNPSHGALNINLDKWISSSKPFQVKVYSATGQLVYKNEQQAFAGQLNVNLQSINSGSYFLVLEHENLIYTKQVIIAD